MAQRDKAMKKYPFEFLVLPETIWLDERMSFGAKHMLAILLRYSQANFYKEISHKWLAERMKVGQEEVRRRTRELEKTEYLSIIERRGRVNGYKLNISLMLPTHPTIQRPPSAIVGTPPTVTEGTPPTSYGGDNTGEIVQENIAKAIPLTLSDERGADLTSPETISVREGEKAIDAETGEEIPSPHELKKAEKAKIYAAKMVMMHWAEARRGRQFLHYDRQLKALERIRSAKISMDEAQGRWLELEGDRFYQEKGFDWTSVASSFDRRP